MERFCDKCGTLVSGDGTFCPQCGASLPGAVNLTKPSNDMMGTVTPGVDNVLRPGEHPETDEYFTGAGDHFTNNGLGNDPMPTLGRDIPSPSAPVPPVSPVPPTGQANMNYQQYGSSPAPASGGSYGTMPNYPQNMNVNSSNSQDMSVGQWVGTCLLGSCLGIISLILLFVWAFGDTPQPKKNYARAMLIIQACAVGLYIILMIGMIACTGTIFGADFWDEIMY